MLNQGPPLKKSTAHVMEYMKMPFHWYCRKNQTMFAPAEEGTFQCRALGERSR